MSTGKRNGAKRGLGSIIAAAFIVLILISGFTFYTVILRSMNSYNSTASEMNQADVNRSREQLTIAAVKITSENKLNLTVTNTGSLSSRLLWLGLFNQSVTPETQWFFELNEQLEPTETKTILSNFSVAKDQKYVIQISTSAGNTFTTKFYPASETICALTLVAGAPTVYLGNNITLFLTVTHNDTEVDVIQNITVTLQPSPPGLVTAVEQPASLTVESLRRGETAFFRWIYATTSIGVVTFNATYNQAPTGLFALATVNIENALSDGGAGQVTITGVNGSSTFYPSQWNTLGGTQFVSGIIANLKSSDANPVVFSSYFTGSGTNIEQYVNNNTSNVDGSPSKGTHSNFTAQKYGPDAIYDTLTESPLTLINTYYPSTYNLLGSTQLISGAIADVNSDNGAYMTFQSYPSATSPQTLYAHSETMTIGSSQYYIQRLSSSDGAASTLSASMATTGRQLLGKFTYPLIGVALIPASTWTMYYRAWTDAGFNISFDSSNSANSGGSAVTSLSWSHTTGSGSNRLLVVGVSIRTASVSVLSITYGAQSLTHIRSDIHPGGNIRSELWYLIAPNSGTATITVTLSGSSKVVGGSASYSGVAQTAPVDSQAGGTGTSTAPSQGITVNTANCWIVGNLATRGSSANVAEGAGQTTRWDNAQPSGGSADSRCRGHGSDKGPVGAGSQSMSWSLSSSTDWAVSVIALKNASPVATVNVDLVVRKADGTIRTTLATGVATSSLLLSTPSTLQGTYSWSSYTVENQTDYLEIDYYINVSSAVVGASAYLRIDDNTLPTTDQTRAANIMLPSQYTVSVEFFGTSATSTLTALTWAIDSHFSTSNVATTFQLYNYNTAAYPTSGDGYMADTINITDFTKTQTILANPNHFIDSNGSWRLKITGTKAATSPFNWQVDLIQYNTTSNNYVLDLEVQWINVNFSQANKQLCIYGGAMADENLQVDVWTGSTWQNLFPYLTVGWNNVSISPYLTSSTFTIRFTGGTEIADPIQSSWNIDASLLHLWTITNQYTVEVEFTGVTSMTSWASLHWSIQTSWTTPEVSVTIQFYNYTSGSYITSGAGYLAYTSNVIPHTYELKNQLVTSGAEDFVDNAGNWKVKIKGVKDTTSPFNINVDLVDANVDYLSSGNTIPYGAWQLYTIKATSANGNPIPYSSFAIYTNGTNVLLRKLPSDPNTTLSNPDWDNLNVNGEYSFYLKSTSATSEVFVLYVAVGTTLGQKTITQEAPQ
ncbi:MAG: hypothetical protein N3D85_07045 [Candidatus Bathyarchaeota archaeon]|nr:hypothetical protein [Candidatus Bathyarchaeota archaeon]